MKFNIHLHAPADFLAGNEPLHPLNSNLANPELGLGV
jgi:hypothetical protein